MLDVPQQSVYIAFGIVFGGRGQAWLSDVRFEEAGTEVSVTAPCGEYPTDVQVSSHQVAPDAPGNLDFAHAPEHCTFQRGIPSGNH